MNGRLLDVNVLISLLDSAHVNHQATLGWFKLASAQLWATCPMTENGFVRVVSGFSYPNMRLTPAMAAESLSRVKLAFPNTYRFWPSAVSLADPSMFQLSVLIGSRQVSDAYLAGLAYSQGGRLVTLDGNIPWRAVRGATAELVERIPI
jgi:toxin-antitoxin system PIN domain toxin